MSRIDKHKITSLETSNIFVSLSLYCRKQSALSRESFMDLKRFLINVCTCLRE
uniref:Uncharacterized protein n=1 Tax=Rhizophora mucronata TaxID=61149 RepID=A0A2P2MXU5_RHIMU